MNNNGYKKWVEDSILELVQEKETTDAKITSKLVQLYFNNKGAAVKIEEIEASIKRLIDKGLLTIPNTLILTELGRETLKSKKTTKSESS